MAKDNWQPLEEVNWKRPIRQLHLDTRDFHVSILSKAKAEELQRPDLRTLRKYKNDFFWSKEELAAYFKALKEATGGGRGWRYLEFYGNWDMKYIRCFWSNRDKGFVLCNSAERAIRKSKILEWIPSGEISAPKKTEPVSS